MERLRMKSSVWLFALVALCGAGLGRLGGLSVIAEARAGTCDIERIGFSNAAQTVDDDDDGVDEDNRWTMHGGRDDAKTLACNDGSISEDGVDGQADNDDVGGGSGSDYVSGGDNSDAVAGGTSGLFGDTLRGNDGADSLVDKQSGEVDVGSGGAGDDDIDFLDGDGLDSANGDNGDDTCHTDGGDSRSSCEHS